MERDKKLKYITRIETDSTRVVGWQVRLTGRGNYLSKLFSDNVYGGKENALEAAFEFRDKALSERGDLLDNPSNRFRVTLSSLPANNTSGILGVSRTISRERNGGTFPLWQTSYRLPNGNVKNNKFSVNKYGELKSLIFAVESRRDGMMNLFAHDNRLDLITGYARIIDEYENIISYLRSLSDDDSQNLIEYLSSQEVSPTSKKEMLERRIAQQIFRNRIMEFWGHRCAITGASAFVIASHIKPWAVANDEERVSLHNGLALSPNYDKSFDLGFISFDENGRILISNDFKKQAPLLGIADHVILPKYSPFHDNFMKYHRNNIYREKGTSMKL